MEFAPLVKFLQEAGPFAMIGAGSVVGLFILMVLLSKGQGVLLATREGKQTAEFQDKLLALVDKLTASEDALRKRLEEVQGENATLRDDVVEMKVTLSLIREQRRRLIDLLRALKEGRMHLGEVSPLDLGGTG